MVSVAFEARLHAALCMACSHVLKHLKEASGPRPFSAKDVKKKAHRVPRGLRKDCQGFEPLDKVLEYMPSTLNLPLSRGVQARLVACILLDTTVQKPSSLVVCSLAGMAGSCRISATNNRFLMSHPVGAL